jgi:hypothetical protein
MRGIAILPLLLTLTLASPVEAAKPSKAPPAPARQSVGMGCVAPPAGWKVTWLQHEDWVSGQVKETSSDRFVSFAIGTGGAPAASPARIAQFQWLKTEKLGDADLHYGLEKKSDGHFILEATVLRGPLVANFISPQRDLQSLPSLLSIARSYSEKCPEAVRTRK